jgi:tetratricopeptide (TPR) repeat protein
MALSVAKHFSELIKSAKLLEEEGETEKAMSLYKQAIKQKPMEELPYNRLMIYYRKERNYEEELKVIKQALDVFTDHYDKLPEKLVGKNKKVEQLSKALLKSVNKGKKPEPYYPEPIPKWIKRREMVEKKMGK